jgi:hypothetical protein
LEENRGEGEFVNTYGFNWYAGPAAFTVIAGVIILYLTRSDKPRSYLAKLYRVLVVALAAHNFDELLLFVFANNNLPGTMSVDIAYYTLSMLVAAILAHLSIALATDFEIRQNVSRFTVFFYAPVLLVAIPLWTTDWMLTGWKATEGVMPGVAFNSLHGPLFLALPGSIMTYLAVAAVVLVAGRRSTNKQRRMRCNVVLFSITPLVIYAYIGLLQLLRILPMTTWFNVTFAGPTSMFFFLLGTGYAIYRHRLLDIEFYIPWSTERRIKREFYGRIQTVAERIPHLRSPEAAMQHISEVLRCPVVVRAQNETIMTPSAISRVMATIPMEPFAKYDTIIAVDEVAYKDPELAELMRSHRVFAAVPVPQGIGPNAVVTWVFLGEELGETVYSSRDFAMMGMLFRRMEVVFVNEIGDVRNEMKQIRQQLQTIEATLKMVIGQNYTTNAIGESQSEDNKNYPSLVVTQHGARQNKT